MHSIFTKYLPATTHKGARVKAWTSGNSGVTVTASWDYAMDQSGNHMCAAMALAHKLNWGGTWHEGSAGPKGNVYVCESGDNFYVVAVPK